MTENARSEFSLEEIAAKIVDVTKTCSAGYRSAVSQFSTEQQTDAADKCAIAVGNVGFFLLQSFGYSTDEIRQMYAR